MAKGLLRSDFMILCYGLIIVFLYPVIVFPKGAFELLINQHHTALLDMLFKYVTLLGDGILLALLLIFLLFYKYLYAIIAAFSILFQSVFVSIFKRWIFKGLERPIAFFNDTVDLNFVDGVDVHTANTFPSGHTATGFAIFAILFIVIKKRNTLLSLLLFLLAFLVAFSRVYLLQHFVIDVYFGAIFGVGSVVLGLYVVELLFGEQKINKLSNSSLLDVIRRKKHSTA